MLRLALIKELVQLTPLLSTSPPQGDLPDSFGFAYTTLCDAMIDALKDMDAATFDLVYPILVPSALKAHDRVKSELAESSAENVLYFATDVMLDVMEISGYAYLWKFGLGEERFWDSVTGVWDGLLSRYRKPADLITLIARGEDFHKQQFATSPRSQIRWQWRGRMRQLLEDKGFAPRNIVSRTLPNVIVIDPVASTYLQHWKFRKARDLMLSEYLLKGDYIPSLNHSFYTVQSPASCVPQYAHLPSAFTVPAFVTVPTDAIFHEWLPKGHWTHLLHAH